MKRILVTGANKGIGLAICRKILETEDDTFVFLGSRNVDRGNQAKEKLTAENSEWSSRIEVLELDVGSDDSVAAAAQKVTQQLSNETSPLYGIVNNAGIGLHADTLRDTLNVNMLGQKRICEAFLPLLAKDGGRVVNITSASGPSFVSNCSADKQSFFKNADVTWDALQALIDDSLSMDGNPDAYASAGLSDGRPYGLSKALANSYTMLLARENPSLHVNACTPGYIATDMTYESVTGGRTPEELGMKPPEEGVHSTMHLLFGKPEGNGWYYGSDAKRSPVDRYRSPGTPAYAGD